MTERTKKRAGPKRAAFGGKLRVVLLAAGALLVAWLAWEWLSLPGTDELQKLQRGPVRDSALIRARKEAAQDQGRKLRVRQQYVELAQVSPWLIKAVLASEDARFFAHEGIDVVELQAAVEGAVKEGKRLRGASTLTQQVAKNLFLSESRSLLRKAKEAYLAWKLDDLLTKRRILTLYLNVAEWGEGVFGIEAAARTHLKKSAREITLAEAAALAAMLPNPIRFTPAKPSSLYRRALHVLDRIEDERMAKPAQLTAARQELDAWLGGKANAQEATAEK